MQGCESLRRVPGLVSPRAPVRRRSAEKVTLRVDEPRPAASKAPNCKSCRFRFSGSAITEYLLHRLAPRNTPARGAQNQYRDGQRLHFSVRIATRSTLGDSDLARIRGREAP